MTHAAIARWLLVFLCGAQGAATLAIDLNRTHATNPHWPRHARFHLVWQSFSYAWLCVLEIALIVAPGPVPDQRFYLAAILASIPMLSCLAAFACRRIYGGALSDANGIPPVKVVMFGSELHVDLNLASEAAALVFLLGILAFFRH